MKYLSLVLLLITMNSYAIVDFKNITVEKLEAEIYSSIDDYRNTIQKALATKEVNWYNFMQLLEDAENALSNKINLLSHLHSVQDNAEVRSVYERVLPKLSDFSAEVSQNGQLYTKLQKFKEQDYTNLANYQRAIIDHMLRDFKLSGVNLPKEQQDKYREISKKLSQLSNQFSQNVLDATKAWRYHISEQQQDRLAGIPAHTIEHAREKALEQNLDGWLLTLDAPCVDAVLSYAKDRGLREKVYEAYVTRASDQGPFAGKWDNSKLIEQQLQLRQENARLLGFDNFAEYSLATKMASNAKEVQQFLEDLVRYSLPAAKAELVKLQEYAAVHGIDKLQPWDMRFYAEQYQRQNFNITEEQLREYFPVDKVLRGMFALVNKLYGITAEEITKFTSWDPQVRLFAISDANKVLRGHFYIDLYARENKRDGAWMAECMSRHKPANNSMQSPIAFLVANLNPPAKDGTARLSHREVVTLFHEFGHTLHHVLTKVDSISSSGINGVAWDAVELPSQFMENWAWQWEVLQDISEHYKTKEKLPKSMFTNLLAMKNYNAGIGLIRQMEFALFDLLVHIDSLPVQKIIDKVREKTAVTPHVAYNRYQNSFSHIFAGGYAAGYYSYSWAEVLSSDAFAKFQQAGLYDKNVASKFLTTILEQGGSCDAMELYIEFMGRKPRVEALLEQRGILKS